MNILIYGAIFIFKIIEDALATLRIIVISKSKKKLGSILQFIVTLIWIILTGTVLMGLQKDILKAIAFAFGSLFGSYLGSVLEEKIALGTNAFLVEVNLDSSLNLIQNLKNNGFQVSRLKSDNDGKVDVQTITSTFAGYFPNEDPKYSVVVITPNISQNNGTNDTMYYGASKITKELTSFLADNY